jgi:hypothetical protein
MRELILLLSFQEKINLEARVHFNYVLICSVITFHSAKSMFLVFRKLDKTILHPLEKLEIQIFKNFVRNLQNIW